MKHYCITLMVQAGEYEKTTTHVITANGEESACTKAITDEAHNELEWDGDRANEVDGSFAYTIGKCMQVPAADYAVLKKYLNWAVM